ncbi:MAG: hypothetical protein HEQ39_06355 [Rhizobacter sp.]
MQHSLKSIAILFLAALLLTGCGGGGGGGGSVPVISSQPADASVLTGASATFSVGASGASVFQWRRNGLDIAGATSATYVTPPASYLDSGASYSVVVSNASGTVTSASAKLTLVLSANQQLYEELALGQGAHRFSWNLNSSGGQTTGTNYARTDFSLLTSSPLTQGPQNFVQSTVSNLTATLPDVSTTPTRVLRDGTIYVVPSTGFRTRVSYVGSDVQSDSYASDNTTIVSTELRSDYASLPLTGTMAANSTTSFARYLNSFFTNTAVLNQNATFATGSKYITYTSKNKGDLYRVFDCFAATVDANVSPCATGVSLASALTAGIASGSDGKTYFLADGAISTVGGVQVWVANAARPQSATLSVTVQNRIYFALNGNVYTGALVRDGAIVNGSYYISTSPSTLTFLPYTMRMNKAARDSVQAAMAL